MAFLENKCFKQQVLRGPTLFIQQSFSENVCVIIRDQNRREYIILYLTAFVVTFTMLRSRVDSWTQEKYLYDLSRELGCNLGLYMCVVGMAASVQGFPSASYESVTYKENKFSV